MNRRRFLQALLAGSAAAIAPARVYSFLTNNPFALDGYEYRLLAYPALVMRAPGLGDLSALMKQLYPDNGIVERGGPLVGLL